MLPAVCSRLFSAVTILAKAMAVALGVILVLLAILCVILAVVPAPVVNRRFIATSIPHRRAMRLQSVPLSGGGPRVVTQPDRLLMALWTESAFVTNAKNTPDTADDDQFWRGRMPSATAMCARFSRRTGNPAAADLEIGSTATGPKSLPRRIGAEVAPANDRWVLGQPGSAGSSSLLPQPGSTTALNQPT